MSYDLTTVYSDQGGDGDALAAALTRLEEAGQLQCFEDGSLSRDVSTVEGRLSFEILVNRDDRRNVIDMLNSYGYSQIEGV